LNNFEVVASCSSSLVPVLHAGAQVPAVGGCRAGPCEKRPGLPCARYNWLQSGPADPPQGTAEPLCQGGGASVER